MTSYREFKGGNFFLRHSVVLYCWCCTTISFILSNSVMIYLSMFVRTIFYLTWIKFLYSCDLCSYSRISCFCSCDTDPDPVALTCELDLDLLKCTCIPKTKSLGQGFQKLEQEQNRHKDTNTDRCDQTH